MFFYTEYPKNLFSLSLIQKKTPKSLVEWYAECLL